MNILSRIKITRTFVTAIIIAVTALCPRAEKKIIDGLPKFSETISGFSRAEAVDRLKESDLHHIEGIWQFPATGVEVAIMRTDDRHSDKESRITSYRIIILYSPNRSLRPGTVMGLVTPAPKRGEYDARIYTRSVGTSLTMPKRFTLTLDNDDGALSFKQHKSAFSVNLWRLLPYLWRYSVHANQQDKSTEGCIRVYPAPLLPREPVYL